ncbi:MAG: hypothetical protein IH840_15900 [Candidatus Heimdallarchaeota archaeon]|nr:hypothetical protein [Candidatus Heimdallarchaeota archaeon]
MQEKDTGACLVSVLGGRSSEGTDFRDKAMQMVIILGIPFQRPDPISTAKQEYYSGLNANGFEIVSLLPALYKNSQAAGRPLRSLTDRVCVMILEERMEKYIKRAGYLPDWISKNAQVVDYHLSALVEEVRVFFAE